ncbi:MAG: hypothetical protein C0422_09755 [Alcaligenaceae bacterium]|nr:hypothetical protein [Alcaligenaceae bacterium]
MPLPNRLIDWLILRSKRTPYFHLEGYMERYWLLPYARWRPAARIHHILRSDDDRVFHDHPWAYVTVILRGGYWEITPVFDPSGLYQGEQKKWYGPGSVLFRKAKSWHRLELPKGETCWTLFSTGQWVQHWGFLAAPKSKVHWKEYLGEQQQ